MCYFPADSANDAERMQQGCIISQRKTVCEVIGVLGFVCVNLRENKSALADCTGYIQKEQNAF